MLFAAAADESAVDEASSYVSDRTSQSRLTYTPKAALAVNLLVLQGPRYSTIAAIATTAGVGIEFCLTLRLLDPQSEITNLKV